MQNLQFPIFQNKLNPNPCILTVSRWATNSLYLDLTSLILQGCSNYYLELGVRFKMRRRTVKQKWHFYNSKHHLQVIQAIQSLSA